MVLVAMLVFVVLLAGTSLIFLEEGMRSRSEVEYMEQELRALNAAHAGILRAELEIAAGVDEDGDGLGTVEGVLGGTTYDVIATDLGSYRYRLVAAGFCANARRRIEVGVRKPPAGPFTQALFGRVSTKLTGGSHTDSYDSALGTWSSQITGVDASDGNAYANPGGHVGSNGEIVLSGPVRGDAIPGAGYVVDHGEEAWGSTTARAEPQVFADPPLADFEAAWLANDNASIDVSDPNVSYDAANAVLLSGTGAPITLEAGTYIFNTLKMTGGGNLTINGKVTIYITNFLEISGGGVVNVTGIPSDCIIHAHPYDFPAGSAHDKAYVKTSGGSATAFAVYAPAMHVETSGGGTFFGAIVANSIVFSGGSAFHYDEALGRLGGSGTTGVVREYVRHLDD